jgi:hypothetical protein
MSGTEQRIRTVSGEISTRRWGITGESTVIKKAYFVRQATIVFWIAKATKDPKTSAALMDKAADLKSKVDRPGAPPDPIPLAPNIEPPPGPDLGRRCSG